MTLLWCFLREFRRLEVNSFQPCKKLSRLVCALCRKTEQNSKYRNFSTTDLRHGRIRRGCRLFLTIQTFMFERLPLEFVHSHQSILIHLEFNLFVFIVLTYSDGHSSIGNTEMSADVTVSLLNSPTGFSSQLA